jgi:dienelactone hydrolase
VKARGALAALLVLVAAAFQPGETPAAVTIAQGTHEGADFIIGMPLRTRWNGDLVMFAHGYEGEGPGRGTVNPPPLSGQLTKRGYAWAASGYRSRGYHPDRFMADTLALRERFIREFGRPKRTIIHGQALGGHVAVASLERHPEVYQGAFVECGVLDSALTGKIRVPLMTIHEPADLRVPVRLEQDYRRRAVAAGTARLLVQRAVGASGPCAFDTAARMRAFDDLADWIEHGKVPAGDDPARR